MHEVIQEPKNLTYVKPQMLIFVINKQIFSNKFHKSFLNRNNIHISYTYNSCDVVNIILRGGGGYICIR